MNNKSIQTEVDASFLYQVLFGLAAAAVTFSIGKLIGIAV